MTSEEGRVERYEQLTQGRQRDLMVPHQQGEWMKYADHRLEVDAIKADALDASRYWKDQAEHLMSRCAEQGTKIADHRRDVEGLEASLAAERKKAVDIQAINDKFYAKAVELEHALYGDPMYGGGALKQITDALTKADWARIASNGWEQDCAKLTKQVADLRGQLEAAKRDVNTLNQLLRDKGYGQGEIDGMAADCDELEQLRSLVEALDSDFWSYEQQMCDRERAGLTREQRTGACIVLHWLNQRFATLAQAQPKGEQ